MKEFVGIGASLLVLFGLQYLYRGETIKTRNLVGFSFLIVLMTGGLLAGFGLKLF